MPLWAWIALANCIAVLWVFSGVLGELQVSEPPREWMNVSVRVLVVVLCLCLGVLIALAVEVPAYLHVRRLRRKRRAA